MRPRRRSRDQIRRDSNLADEFMDLLYQGFEVDRKLTGQKEVD